VACLSLAGGANVDDTVRNILRSLMTNHVTAKCNYGGRGTKMAFGDLISKQVVVGRCMSFSQSLHSLIMF